MEESAVVETHIPRLSNGVEENIGDKKAFFGG